MGIDYTALLAEVGTLLESNGRAVTLVSKSNTADDLAKPWGSSTASDLSVTATGVFTSYNATEVDDEIVRRGDMKLYVKGDVQGSSLEDFDQVVDGSDTWNITEVTTVNPGGTVLLYILQVRL